MDSTQSRSLIRQTFTEPFDKGRFLRFIRNLLNHVDESKAKAWNKTYVRDAFKPRINRFERLATYTDSTGEKIDVLIVHLEKQYSLGRARTSLRNFVADYLTTRGQKEAALVAFVSPQEADWRFSFVKMEYETELSESGKVKIKERLTPARRYSFLVGTNEHSHTAQKQFLPLLENDQSNPTLAEVEQAFGIEKVTKEFFERYKELFEDVRDALNKVLKRNEVVREDFAKNGIEADDFAKKLLGQIVFLYFLQKKGWFGVERNAAWGTGNKSFLRYLFEHRAKLGTRRERPGQRPVNFFNDILEHLFYDALARDRRDDKDYHSRFDCKIPFLNGGLFEPLFGYDWVSTDILLPDTLFSNGETTKEGDNGTGILDVFDRFNFTVNEAEPLEKEVAVDPEMLGKVFENLLPENLRHKGGTYYTPRVIVGYMCQQSLINYLSTHLPDIPRADIETFVRIGYAQADFEASGTPVHKHKFLPDSVSGNAQEVDKLLKEIAVCDPAVGSGAFLVGMMQEIVRARSALAAVADMPERSAYELKLHAIHASLYGVDIDPGAVEIAKLRLWLSLVVDEDDREHIQALPNLDYKVMQGNSLLDEFAGVKLLDDDLLSQAFVDREAQITSLSTRVNELQDQFFELDRKGGRNKEMKQRFVKEIEALKRQKRELLAPQVTAEAQGAFEDLQSEARRTLNEIKRLHGELFRETSRQEKAGKRRQLEQLEWEFMEATLKEHDEQAALRELARHRRDNRKNYFLWKLHFVEVFQAKGGFDVVIANPPYLSALEFAKIFPEDERAALNRNYSSAKGTYDLYVVFIERAIRILRNNGVLSFINPNKFLSAKYAVALRQFISDTTDFLSLVDVSGIRVFETAAVYPVMIFLRSRLASQMSKGSVTLLLPHARVLEEFNLSAYSQITIPSEKLGLLPENIWGFLLSKHLPLLSKLMQNSIPLSALGDVNATSTASESDAFGSLITTNQTAHALRLINTGTIDRYCTLWGLREMTHSGKRILTPYLPLGRKVIGERRKAMYTSPKVIFAKMAKGCEAFPDLRGEYASLNTNCFYRPKDGVSLQFITAFCNSKLFMFLYDQFFGALRMSGGYYQYQAPQLRVMPIRQVSEAKQKGYAAIVERIVAAKRDNPQADTTKLEDEIDRLVYKLYQLTEDEIAIVEGKA